MVLDFAKENIQESAQLIKLHEQIKEGDITVILQEYERELKVRFFLCEDR